MLSKIRNTWWFKIAGILVAMGTVYALIMYGLIVSSYREVPPKNVEVVIVLGAQVKGNKPAYPSPTLQERLDAAYYYLLENPETIVIVTGGQGADEAEPEGDVMARYLMNKGIDESRIIIENKSTSTIENIEFAKELYDIKEAVIVTSDYHLYRAKRTAKQHGIEVVYGLAAPSATRNTFALYLREVLALGYHLIFTHPVGFILKIITTSTR